MFPSLSLRSCLDIVLGFSFGVISAIFVTKLRNELRTNDPALEVTRLLVFYSLSMAVVMLLYASAFSGGLLEEWQRLQFQKGSERAAKILAVGYIQGKSGRLYMYNQQFLERIDAIPEIDNFQAVPTTNNCGALFFLPIPKADFVDSKSACLAVGSMEVKVAFAIDSHGYAYVWQHKAHEFGGVEKFIITIGSGILSCVFGVILALLLLFSNFIIGKVQKKTVPSTSGV